MNGGDSQGLIAVPPEMVASSSESGLHETQMEASSGKQKVRLGLNGGGYRAMQSRLDHAEGAVVSGLGLTRQTELDRLGKWQASACKR